MTSPAWRFTWLAAAVVAVAVGAWLGWRWYSTPEPPYISLEGVQKEIAQAVEAAAAEVRQAPRSGTAWGKLGMVLQAHGFDEQVSACYRNAERFDPANPRWPYLLGLRLLEGNRDESLALFRQALSRAQTAEQRAVIQFRLAQLLIEDRRLEEAETYLQALRQVDSEAPRFHFAMALLAAARNDRPAARSHLLALTEVPFARRQAFGLLATMADDDEAVRKFTEHAAKLPRDEPWPDVFEAEGSRHKVDRLVRIARFWDLSKQGRHDEALDYLRAYVAQKRDGEVAFLLAGQLLARNQLDEAEQAFRDTLRDDPANAKAYLFLGEILCQKGEKLFAEAANRERALDLYREAVAVEDQALALEPGFGMAHLARGRALRRLGRTDEAVLALRAALLSQPQVADVHLLLGLTLAESGQTAEGLQHLEHAAELASPNDPGPRAALEKWRAKAAEPPQKN